jgi:hypothetical protein
MSSPHLALAPPAEPPIGQAQPARVERAARALIGWMKPEDAHRLLMSGSNDTAPDPARIQVARQARGAVAARSDGIAQDNLVIDYPAGLKDHVEALRDNLTAAQMFAEGWAVGLVDLTRVCAFQPLVFCDQAIDRVQGVEESDISTIAAVTLPLAEHVQLPIQFDQIRQAWVVASANPNLRVASSVGPIPTNPGGTALGFAIAVGQSFLQVGRYRRRYFLRDGYHRAFGLLSRGINIVPAFVRDMGSFEELMPDPRAMLPQDSYQGPRPPVLPDYLDDTVSAVVRVPAVHKMIVIQALELTPIG